MAGMTDADEARIKNAFVSALKEVLPGQVAAEGSEDARLQLGDNRYDAQAQAYFATGTAWASKRFSEGADFETVFSEVWARFRPLWSQS